MITIFSLMMGLVVKIWLAEGTYNFEDEQNQDEVPHILNVRGERSSMYEKKKFLRKVVR
jgi:hypothetical protein